MNSLSTTEIIAYIGTFMVAAAYVPQIYHLINKHCAYGLNAKAWGVWLVATLLIIPDAISTGNHIFIALQTINIVATSFITVFTFFHQGKVCDEHKIL